MSMEWLLTHRSPDMTWLIPPKKLRFCCKGSHLPQVIVMIEGQDWYPTNHFLKP